MASHLHVDGTINNPHGRTAASITSESEENMATDTSTVIGVFDRYGTAEQACRKLVDEGIPQEAVQIKSEARTQAAGRTWAADDGDSGGGIAGFFRQLFGADTPEDHVNRFTKRY